MTRKSMTYKGSGVSYDAMDPYKREAQLAARGTAGNLRSLFGGEFQEFEPSRGESAYLIETPEGFLAQVEEGLGTKNLVADAMYRITGDPSGYASIAQCTVAMIVNDIITVGAFPMSVAMHLAVGTSDWFNDKKRSSSLIAGWKRACDQARCTWGGGETPTLKGIVNPEAFVLAGSAIGLVKPKKNLIIGDKIRHGDQIVFIESSGIHANGLTMARQIAAKLSPDPERPELGYLEKLSDGRTYGETLLDPTLIYAGLVQDCLNHGVDIHYAVNITGHGWRKLMRAPQPFTYVIQTLPTRLPIFDFIQKHGSVEDKEMYGNFNMGVGFALYVPQTNALQVVIQARMLGFKAFVAGSISNAGEKGVIIGPKNLSFAADTLAVR